MKCTTWTGQARKWICACNFATDRFTNSAHMEKLELIIVHGSMFSIHNLASSSYDSLMICAILLVLVSTVFLVKRRFYLRFLNMQMQCRVCVHHCAVLSRLN